MTCPRCGNEWDVSKSPCSRCGLLVHLPNGLRSATRSQGPSQNQQQPSGLTMNEKPKRVDESDLPFHREEGTQEGFFEAPSQNRAFKRWQTGSLPSVGNFLSKEGFETPLPTTRESFDQESLRSSGFDVGGIDSLSSSSFLSSFGSESDTGVQRSIPPRPSTPSGQNRAGSFSGIQPSLRAKRLVTDTKRGENQHATPGNQHVDWQREGEQRGFVLNQRENMGGAQIRVLQSSTMLRNKRYQLRELLNRQEWQVGVYEATWLALDAQRGGAQVVITELVIPDNNSMVMQSLLRTATIALTSVGRHPHVPTLWDAFSDQDRNFFVFEPIEGESLSSKMKRTGRALSEQEVIECCVQMADVLDVLGQQTPPMVHGLIRPEHIIISRVPNQYVLTNFSIVLAGGGLQFIAGLDPVRISSYMSPEFVRGVVDTRSDIYALLAIAYHVATGSMPSSVGGSVPSAQRLNPTLSSGLDQLLTKGMRSLVTQRYQRVSELRADLLAIHMVGGSLVSGRVVDSREANSGRVISVQEEGGEGNVARILPQMLEMDGVLNERASRALLPRPEALPVMPERNDILISLLWIAGIVICVVIIVILSRVLNW